MAHYLGVLFVKPQQFALLSPLQWQRLMSTTDRLQIQMPVLHAFQNCLKDVWSQVGHAKDLRHPPRLQIESTRQIPCCCIFAILKQALSVERFAQDLDHRDIHATRHHVDIVPDGGVSSFLFCLRRILSGIIVTL